MELKNKVVIITGGTKGLGKSLAFSFKSKDCNVVVCARKEEDFKDLPEGILGIKADVTNEEDLDNLLKITLEKFGQVDIWVNNAGLWLQHSFVEDFDINKVKNMFDVNVFGSINGSRVALRYMKKRGIGTILNIISDSALVGRSMSAMYCASKWAVNGFTKSIREENKNLSILSVYPGGMKTDIFGENKPKNFDTFMSVEYVSEKIIDNLKKDIPEEELIIQSKK
jgi:short-subunit dehydrogenase